MAGAAAVTLALYIIKKYKNYINDYNKVQNRIADIEYAVSTDKPISRGDIIEDTYVRKVW